MPKLSIMCPILPIPGGQITPSERLLCTDGAWPEDGTWDIIQVCFLVKQIVELGVEEHHHECTGPSPEWEWQGPISPEQENDPHKAWAWACWGHGAHWLFWIDFQLDLGQTPSGVCALVKRRWAARSSYGDRVGVGRRMSRAEKLSIIFISSLEDTLGLWLQQTTAVSLLHS